MSGTERLYFARCVCFFKDANDVHYVALRWLSEIPGVVFDPASQMAPFTMAPLWETKSFDSFTGFRYPERCPRPACGREVVGYHVTP